MQAAAAATVAFTKLPLGQSQTEETATGASRLLDPRLFLGVGAIALLLAGGLVFFIRRQQSG